ncbi:MAG TPA: dihydrofolate reductase family protein [Solirubrobacteraceae bacterium]|nr:dihydrofolate reductase family protein [Solirubrobacteraceae bacterium]
MGNLIYVALASLDGYVEDASGSFERLAPDEEVHAFVNDLERPVRTHLYGRRMYEVMSVWETLDDPEPVMRDFAGIWRTADKVVYSRTLAAPTTERTSVERDFDRAAVREIKAATEHDLSIGGAQIAAEAFRAGLVDEIHLLLAPVLFGAGKPALPAGLSLDLELVSQRRFAGGVVHLHHRLAG